MGTGKENFIGVGVGVGKRRFKGSNAPDGAGSKGKIGDREREGVSGLHPIWRSSRRDEAFGQIGCQAAKVLKVERVDPVGLGLARTLNQ